MATTRTARARLGYPGAVGDRNWHVPIQDSLEALDGINAVGALCVAPAEIPSASLNVRVAAGSYQALDGTIATYAGTTAQAITASSTRYVWIEVATGALTVGAAWPATTHVRLATVVAGASTITSVADARIAAATFVPRRAAAIQATITDSSGGTAGNTATGADANTIASIVARLNEIRDTLIAAGHWKGSA